MKNIFITLLLLLSTNNSFCSDRGRPQTNQNEHFQQLLFISVIDDLIFQKQQRLARVVANMKQDQQQLESLQRKIEEAEQQNTPKTDSVITKIINSHASKEKED